jgi:hypothetical protein
MSSAAEHGEESWKFYKVWPRMEHPWSITLAAWQLETSISVTQAHEGSTVHELESSFTSSSIRSSSRYIFFLKSHLISSPLWLRAARSLDGACEGFDTVLVEYLLKRRLIPFDFTGIIIRILQAVNLLEVNNFTLGYPWHSVWRSSESYLNGIHISFHFMFH